MALVLANLNSYFWNTRWTFRGRAQRRNPRQRLLFTLQALFNICISNGLFFLLIRPVLIYTDIPTYLAGNVAKVIFRRRRFDRQLLPPALRGLLPQTALVRARTAC